MITAAEHGHELTKAWAPGRADAWERFTPTSVRNGPIWSLDLQTLDWNRVGVTPEHYGVMPLLDENDPDAALAYHSLKGEWSKPKQKRSTKRRKRVG